MHDLESMNRQLNDRYKQVVEDLDSKRKTLKNLSGPPGSTDTTSLLLSKDDEISGLKEEIQSMSMRMMEFLNQSHT